VLGPYREVLRVPGAVAFVVAGLVARLPISMQTLGVVLLVRATTGSYALAGAVSATFALAQALLAPLLGRLVDRHGQARVLLPALLLYAAGLGGLVTLALAGAPSWTLFPAALMQVRVEVSLPDWKRSPIRPPQPEIAPSGLDACQKLCWSLWLNNLGGSGTFLAV